MNLPAAPDAAISAATNPASGLNLRCARVSADPGELDIVVSGALLEATAGVLQAVLRGALDAGAHTLRVDLAGVTAVDHRGFAPLLTARRRLRQRCGRWEFVGFSAECLALFTAPHQRVQQPVAA